MADYQEVLARVIKVTAEVLDIDESEVAEDKSFSYHLGAESIDSIKLVVAFDEEFGIEMDEAEATQVQTVGAAVKYILKYLD
ncbi:MAG: acyl carrier protein [Candidatus Glassbacteria bacterium]|nr:acyl carrier protein [Candidatus Glassbacteria bacterium]